MCQKKALALSRRPVNALCSAASTVISFSPAIGGEQSTDFIKCVRWFPEVDDRMAVGADWPKIGGGVNDILSCNFRQRLQVVDMNVAL